MTKKYTKQDIEIIIKEAIMKAVSNMEKHYDEVIEDNEADKDVETTMQKFAFTMQNMLAMKELEKTIMEELK